MPKNSGNRLKRIVKVLISALALQIVSYFVDCRTTESSQVVVNLITNAKDDFKNNKEKQGVKIFTMSDSCSNSPQIKVRDSGKGPKPQVAEKILNPFFKKIIPKKGPYPGLSVGSNIITRIKGRMFVDHSFENATFVIEIPFTHDIEKTNRRSV